MDALKKRMIIRFAPYHPNKMDVLPKTFLKIMLKMLLMVIVAFKYVPHPAATTFAFASVFILLLHLVQIQGNINVLIPPEA